VALRRELLLISRAAGVPDQNTARPRWPELSATASAGAIGAWCRQTPGAAGAGIGQRPASPAPRVRDRTTGTCCGVTAAAAAGPIAAIHRRNVASRDISRPRQHYVRMPSASRVHLQPDASDPSWQRAQKRDATAPGHSHDPTSCVHDCYTPIWRDKRAKRALAPRRHPRRRRRRAEVTSVGRRRPSGRIPVCHLGDSSRRRPAWT
jgi:hypothetical protein